MAPEKKLISHEEGPSCCLSENCDPRFFAQIQHLNIFDDLKRNLNQETSEYLILQKLEVSEKGRHLFTHRTGLKLNQVGFGSLKNQRAILQLQSGYSILKEYQNKVWIADSPTFECKAIEDVQHFLLECPSYHVPRETLRRSLLLSCGIEDFDTEIVLSVTDDKDLKDIRPLIWDQLDMYITQTKRFRVDLDCMVW